MYSTAHEPTVAIVYDWIDTAHGGAEKVLQALHEAFPQAPVFTSVAIKSDAPWTKSLDIRSSFLQRIPGLGRRPRQLVPFFPLAFESFQLDQYQVVLSVTSAFAKGVITKPNQLHFCYLLTPPRYIYSHRDKYLKRVPGIPGLRWAVNQVFRYLQWWDEAAAMRPDVIVPISELVGQRCRTYYHREPEKVIYPPVEFLLQERKNVASSISLPDSFALVISRLVPYKQIDVAIKACVANGQSLVIVGDGPDRTRLEEIAEASPLIHFLGSQSQPTVAEILAQASTVLMPGLEDFGITAAEAVAAGKPVIVHRKSGVAEILKDGVSGVLLEEVTVRSVSAALLKVGSIRFNSQILTQSMRKYATTSFVRQIRSEVIENWQALESRKAL